MRKCKAILGIITAFALWYAVAFVGGKLLPDEWCFKWYGVPTLMLLAWITVFGVLVSIFGLAALIDDR